MTETVFDIQRCSTVDGPGIRTTVFFKGCNLRCLWCHNPESRKKEAQMMFYKNKCTGCGKCREVCPNSLESCTLCGKCELYCPNDARKICGREMTADEIFSEVKKDIPFYNTSGGGATFSGGECMLYPDFLCEVLKKCREAGIHTAVDTAGCVPYESFRKVLPYTDMFLYDMKCFSEEKHIGGTGVSNKKILSNLSCLAKENRKIIIRIPLIPGFNDSDEELAKMRDFLFENRLYDIEVLPYHAMGEHKYEAIGESCTKFVSPSRERLEEIKKMFTK